MGQNQVTVRGPHVGQPAQRLSSGIAGSLFFHCGLDPRSMTLRVAAVQKLNQVLYFLDRKFASSALLLTPSFLKQCEIWLRTVVGDSASATEIAE